MDDALTQTSATSLLLACLAVSGHTQEVGGNTWPTSKAPLDATSQGTRFIALAREPGPNAKKGNRNHQATIWEIPIGQPAQRRVVLGPSPWTPRPLLDSANLLYWQVPPTAKAKGMPYEARVLRVNYRDFKVTELLHTPRARAIGGSGDSVYLNTPRGQLLLNVSTGAVEKVTPELVVLAKHGDDWLVETEGIVARFDAAKHQITRRYQTLKASKNRGVYGYTIWKGNRFALQLGRFVNAKDEYIGALDFGKPSIVYRELRVWDLETGAESKLRVRTLATGGSGIGVIPMEMRTELVGGMFRYTEIRPLQEPLPPEVDWERDIEWVTIDIANGKELLRVPYHQRDLNSPDPLKESRVPNYLRGEFEGSSRHKRPDTDDIAHAFLTQKGIDVVGPPDHVGGRFDSDCRTLDGEQILVLDNGTFYLCDLKAQTIAKWAAPKAFAKASVELHAVSLR